MRGLRWSLFKKAAISLIFLQLLLNTHADSVLSPIICAIITATVSLSPSLIDTCPQAYCVPSIYLSVKASAAQGLQEDIEWILTILVFTVPSRAPDTEFSVKVGWMGK